MEKLKEQRNYIFFAIIFFSFIIYNAMYHSNFIDGDLFWHLKVGEKMLQTHHVVREAFNTYAGNHLPYTTQETMYQLLVITLYKIGNWTLIYIVTLLNYLLFTWGIIKVVNLSRREYGVEEENSTVTLLMICYSILILGGLVTFKTSAISMSIFIWYFYWLKQFMKNPNVKKSIILGILSLFMSNFHGGTWVVIFVFFIMAIIHSIVEKKFNRNYVIALILIVIGGIANSDGIHTLLYAFQLGKEKINIIAFRPIDFQNNKVFTIDLFIFLFSAHYSFKKDTFEKLLISGIFYLGLMNSYEHIFLIYLAPYFYAVGAEHLPKVSYTKYLTKKTFFLWNVIAVMVLIFSALYYHPIKVPTYKFPVKEMNYIVNHNKKQVKVLTDYVSSGYVVYRNEKVLADPRFDPYIQKSTELKNGWSAFKRQANAMYRGTLVEEVKTEKPDYVILPKVSETDYQELYYERYFKELGKPVYVGPFGYVLKIK